MTAQYAELVRLYLVGVERLEHLIGVKQVIDQPLRDGRRKGRLRQLGPSPVVLGSDVALHRPRCHRVETGDRTAGRADGRHAPIISRRRMAPAYLVFCWFHAFWHPFDGVSDGWMCHAWGPKGMVRSEHNDGQVES